MATKPNPHYVILNALYALYKDSKDNQPILDKISTIGWALGVDLDFPDGFFELSELINYGDQQNAKVHDIEVIEKSLKDLETKPWEAKISNPQ